MSKFRIRFSFKIILITILIWISSNIVGGINMSSLKGSILFTDGGGWIYLANINNVQNTIREFFRGYIGNHLLGWDPYFSSNCSYIIFAKDNPMGWPLSESPKYEIMIVDREVKNFKKVIDMGKTPCGYPSWSPDGTKIAFLARDQLYNPVGEGGQGELFTCSVDGSNLRKITEIQIFPSRPSWMPDSKKIVFASKDGKIYGINYDGAGLKEIVRGFAPSVSPDGKKIA
ncbi:MAG: hypothetical protein NT033_09960, partial [Candidatus Omnitrophica bacterium]|nr:hypothetical protein [Candidatus Omnitrophota bacterium]